MDLTTLSVLLAFLAGLLSLDTVLHPTGVVVETAIPAKYDKVTVDADTLGAVLNSTVAAISSMPSMNAAPEIRIGAPKGIGMAVAEAVNMKGLALALQYEFGNVPEQIKLSVIGEDSTTKILVSGSGLGGRIRTPPFEEMLILKPGETLVQMVHRAAIAGLSRIDPYFTALYLIQQHAMDRDFAQAKAIIEGTLAQFPPTPVSPDRADFINLQGIIALFGTDNDAALALFDRAASADPEDPVSVLNAAFVEVQVDRYHDAVDRMRKLTTMQPAPNYILLGTAYMTWGAALLGLHDVHGADQMLAKAVEINPDSSAAFELWADVKREKGDIAASQRMHRRALENSEKFENYAELAALWFQLSWQDGQALVRNQYNPLFLQFNK